MLDQHLRRGLDPHHKAARGHVAFCHQRQPHLRQLLGLQHQLRQPLAFRHRRLNRTVIDDFALDGVGCQRRQQDFQVLGRHQPYRLLGPPPNLGFGDGDTLFGDGFLGKLAKRPVNNGFRLLCATALGVEPGNHKDHPPVALLGRADQAIARFLGVACLQPVSADPQLQQRVAVADVGGRAAIEFERGLGKQRVVFREVLDQPLGQDRQVMHRHPVTGGRPAVRVGEGRGGHAQILGPLGHVAGKAGLGAIGAQCFGNHHAGVIARQHDDAAQQVLDPHPVGGVQEHGGAAIAHRVLAHRQPLIQRQPPVAQGFKRHIQRHQLGHGGRRQRHIRVLGQKHRIGARIQHIGRARAGIKGRSRQRRQADRQARRQRQPQRGFQGLAQVHGVSINW